MNSNKFKINKKLNEQYVDINDINYNIIEFKLNHDNKISIYNFEKNNENKLYYVDLFDNFKNDIKPNSEGIYPNFGGEYRKLTKNFPNLDITFYNNNNKIININVYNSKIKFYNILNDLQLNLTEEEVLQFVEECDKIKFPIISEYHVPIDIDCEKTSKLSISELEVLANIPGKYHFVNEDECLHALFKNKNLTKRANMEILIKLLNKYIFNNYPSKYYNSISYKEAYNKALRKKVLEIYGLTKETNIFIRLAKSIFKY